MRAIVKTEVEVFFCCRDPPGIKRINWSNQPGSFDKILHKRHKVQDTRNKKLWARRCALSIVPCTFILSLQTYEQYSCSFCTQPNRWFAYWRRADGSIQLFICKAARRKVYCESGGHGSKPLCAGC